MARGEFEERKVLALTNPNRGWVVKELDKLKAEWADWFKESESWTDYPEFDRNTMAESMKDGPQNHRRHEVLREKTVTFIGNNFTGYGFLFANWPQPPHETNQDRLRNVIPDWQRRLNTLAGAIEYARVPDGFWTERGKELITTLAKVGPEEGAKIAGGWLKNPFA